MMVERRPGRRSFRVRRQRNTSRRWTPWRATPRSRRSAGCFSAHVRKTPRSPLQTRTLCQGSVLHTRATGTRGPASQHSWTTPATHRCSSRLTNAEVW